MIPILINDVEHSQSSVGKTGRLSRIGLVGLALIIFAPWAQAQTEVSIGIGSIIMRLNEFNNLENGNTLVYPVDYTVYGSMGCVYGGGFVIASRNFSTKWMYNPSTGSWSELQQPTVAPYFVSEASTRYYQDLQHSTIPVSIKRYWKYRPPDRIVNGTNYSDRDWNPYDEVGGPAMICDQMIVATCNTGSGISLTQRAYSFADRAFDDFIIVEYVFKNTGNINSDPAVEYPNNQVQQCFLGLHFVPQPSPLGQRILSGNTSWSAGVDDWIDYYADTVGGEPIRVLYGWDGDSPLYTPDDEGDPLPASGIFMSTQYPGMAVLHVDRAVNDGRNDPNQPVMTYYSFGGASSGNAFSIRAGGGLGAEGIWNEFNSGKKFRSPFNWGKWKSNQVEEWTSNNNNPSQEYYKTGTMGFGPYDFRAIGDSVRIVVCYAVGTMGWTQAVNVGQQWKRTVDNIVGGITLANKNKALRTGRDTLFTKISRVSKLFRDANGNFALLKGASIIGRPPKSPGLTLAPSPTGGTIDLRWENVGASKYKVYRRFKPSFSLEDSQTELLRDPYPLTAPTVTGTSWTDTTVGVGRNYWYAVTAVDASGLESSRFLNRTDPTLSDPTRGSVTPTGSLLDVTVVPNPYDRRSERLYALPTNTIKFYGLTPECRIRIYSQNGDLVATLQHYPLSGNIEQWNMLSDSNQYVAAGLYLYVVDQTRDDTGRDLGLASRGKFVIIR